MKQTWLRVRGKVAADLREGPWLARVRVAGSVGGADGRDGFLGYLPFEHETQAGGEAVLGHQADARVPSLARRLLECVGEVELLLDGHLHQIKGRGGWRGGKRAR